MATLVENETRTESDAAAAQLIVCLPGMGAEALEQRLHALEAAFPNEAIVVASPDADASGSAAGRGSAGRVTFVPYAQARAEGSWVLTAADFAAAGSVAAGHPEACLLLLGNETDLAPEVLHHLAHCVRGQGIDLAVPRYAAGAAEGLVNAALLYPLSRALFVVDIRFPLAGAAALTPRMARRLGTAAQRQTGGYLWPVAEAAVAGFPVRQAPAGAGLPPRPEGAAFQELFQAVASSLFADVEAKAAFWQRARSPLSAAAPAASSAGALSPELAAELEPMLASFHLAHTNLQEIWSLVLPPQSRVALKRLAQMPAESFAMEPGLWARTVYDFALAFHLRTLNRGHLLGAMTPLYMAWAASHLRACGDDAEIAAQRVEATAQAFEREKAYFVQRWRWPDRFNP